MSWDALALGFVVVCMVVAAVGTILNIVLIVRLELEWRRQDKRQELGYEG